MLFDSQMPLWWGYVHTNGSTHSLLEDPVVHRHHHGASQEGPDAAQDGVAPTAQQPHRVQRPEDLPEPARSERTSPSGVRGLADHHDEGARLLCLPLSANQLRCNYS